MVHTVLSSGERERERERGREREREREREHIHTTGHVRQEIAAEDEREEEFVFLEERTTDVAVEVIGEVVGQIAQATVQVLGLGTAWYTYKRHMTIE